MREALLYLLTSFWLGAVHAATPGHGKTIAAAYIVSARGHPIDALILGIFVAYGFVNPLANRIQFNNSADQLCLKCIMQAVAGVGETQDLVLIAPFEPAPLYGVLGQQGFQHESKELDSGDWAVVTVAEWRNPEAMATAQSLAGSEYAKSRFDTREFIKRLGIEADFGVYTVRRAE